MSVLGVPITAVHRQGVLIQTEGFSVIVSLATLEMESVAVSHTNEWSILNLMMTHMCGSTSEHAHATPSDFQPCLCLVYHILGSFPSPRLYRWAGPTDEWHTTKQ